MGQVTKGLIGSIEGVGRSRDSDADAGREGEELVAVGPGVGGNASHLALQEEMALVVEPGDITEMDAGDGQGAAPIQSGQGHRNELSGRCEEDGGVEGLGDGPARRSH